MLIQMVAILRMKSLFVTVQHLEEYLHEKIQPNTMVNQRPHSMNLLNNPLVALVVRRRRFSQILLNLMMIMLMLTWIHLIPSLHLNHVQIMVSVGMLLILQMKKQKRNGFQYLS